MRQFLNFLCVVAFANAGIISFGNHKTIEDYAQHSSSELGFDHSHSGFSSFNFAPSGHGFDFGSEHGFGLEHGFSSSGFEGFEHPISVSSGHGVGFSGHSFVSSGHHQHQELPKAPEETPEVQHAKALHFQAHAEAKKGLSYTVTPQETHEVQLAKAAHFKAVEEAKNNKYHYTITPEETPEVQHAKALHLAEHAKAKAHQSSHHSSSSTGFSHSFDHSSGYGQEHLTHYRKKRGLESHNFGEAEETHLGAITFPSSSSLDHHEFSTGSGLESFGHGLDSHDFGALTASSASGFEGHGLDLYQSHDFGIDQHAFTAGHDFGSVAGGSSFEGLSHGGSHGGSGYTLIHNGKHPVDTPEVEKAKALHLAAHQNIGFSKHI